MSTNDLENDNNNNNDHTNDIDNRSAFFSDFLDGFLFLDDSFLQKEKGKMIVVLHMTAVLPAKKIDRAAAMMHDECPCQLVYTFCVKLQGKCSILNRDRLSVAVRCVCFGKASKMCVSTKGVRSTNRWRKLKHRRPFRPRASTSKNLIKLRTDIKRSAPGTTDTTLLITCSSGPGGLSPVPCNGTMCLCILLRFFAEIRGQ